MSGQSGIICGMKLRRIGVFVWVGLVLIALGLLMTTVRRLPNVTGSGEGEADGDLEDSFPAPTPFLFQELTILYMRGRSYESSLSGLEKISENANYTSYLTSFMSDGLRINGLLTIPKGEMPDEGWPAVVFVHGYIPPSQYRTKQNYVSYVDFLARNNLVVFKIDLRGHDQSEGEAGGAYYSADYVTDTLSAYEALGRAEFVNDNRVGLWGHSMGGNVVFRSFVVRRDIPAVVIWAGAVYTYEDFGRYRISDNSYRPPSQAMQRRRYREELMRTYGEFSTESWFWRQVVPTNYLEGVDGVLQLNHAVDDAVVSVGYSRDLVKILDNTDIIHELNEYASGGHNISGEMFYRAMQNTVDFYQKNLAE